MSDSEFKDLSEREAAAWAKCVAASETHDQMRNEWCDLSQPLEREKMMRIARAEIAKESK